MCQVKIEASFQCGKMMGTTEHLSFLAKVRQFTLALISQAFVVLVLAVKKSLVKALF